jgi:hypothetical protein
MRVTSVFSAVLMAALLASGASLSGCKKKPATEEATVESVEDNEDTITEVQDGGKVSWYVGPDGQVEALVQTSDGKPIEKNVTGNLVWKGPTSEAKLLLTPDPKSPGTFVASGPKLSGDLTEIKYALSVDSKPWNGALHVPAGGTRDLVVNAKAAGPKLEALKGKKGPNGGVLQVVGDDLIEVVADKGSGQVRVYVLDPDLKPIKVGNRKIKLGLAGASPEVVVLSPDPGGQYCVGKLTTKVDPIKLTVAITIEDHTHVVLCGWTPGIEIIVIGPAAPVFKILVVNLGWGVDVRVRTPGVIIIDDDDDHWHHHGHGHGHGRWR